MAAELGYTAEASTELRSLAAEGFSALPVDEEWMTSLALLAEPVAALSDAETAGAIHALMLPYADRCVISYPEISLGAASLYLGILAQTMGQADAAVAHLEAAIAFNLRMGARPWEARARHRLAAVLLSQGSKEAVVRGERELAQAIATFDELGMSACLEAATSLHEGSPG